MIAAVEAISGSKKDKITAIKKIIGTSDGLTEDTARRTEALSIGSVEPECDLDLASLIRDRFPITFRKITDTIFLLTGQGAEPGKLKGSGKKKILKPA